MAPDRTDPDGGWTPAVNAWLSLVCACVVAGAPGLRAADAPRYRVTSVVLEGELQEYRTADLNGDALEDLVVAHYSRARGRELLVFLQRPMEGIPGEADRVVSLKRDIVAFALADVRPEPGVEVLFFTTGSCFSYSTSRSGFAGNAQRLFSGSFLWSAPGARELPFLSAVREAEPGGAARLLVPTREGHVLYARRASREAGGYEAAATFPAAPTIRQISGRRPSRRSRRVILRAGVTRVRDDAVILPGPRGVDGGVMLRVSEWLPAPLFADVDGRHSLDVLRLSSPGASSMLEVFLAHGDGSFPNEPASRADLSDSGEVRVVDVNEDRLADLMVTSGIEDDSGRIGFYLNRGGSFDTREPDQVLRFSGYGTEAEVVDLDADGRPELSVSTYDISAVGALKGGRVNRRVFIHRGAERLFERRPASSFEETFGPEEIRGIAQRVELRADLTGDGRREALLVSREGVLEGRAIDTGLRISGEPFWRFAPSRVVFEVNVLELNRDGRSDLILEHAHALTILVSRP